MNTCVRVSSICYMHMTCIDTIQHLYKYRWLCDYAWRFDDCNFILNTRRISVIPSWHTVDRWINVYTGWHCEVHNVHYWTLENSSPLAQHNTSYADQQMYVVIYIVKPDCLTHLLWWDLNLHLLQNKIPNWYLDLSADVINLLTVDITFLKFNCIHLCHYIYCYKLNNRKQF